MFFRSLSVFIRKHTVNCGTHWLAIASIVLVTSAVLTGCQPHH
jgi:hypothetical protein